jgi:hypothetical protein
MAAYSRDRDIRIWCLNGQIVYGTLKYTPAKKKDQGLEVGGDASFSLSLSRLLI